MKKILAISLIMTFLTISLWGCGKLLGLKKEYPPDSLEEDVTDVDDWTVDFDGDMPDLEDMDIGEEGPVECTEDRHCDDSEMCNGTETCDPVSHECMEGTALEDGTLCFDAPRRICLNGECVNSVCGDCFVDRGNGEFCDDCNDDPDDGCDECRIKCTEDAECLDEDICNGDEYCNTENGYCHAGENLPDGTACGEGPGMICIGGVCSESICGDGFVDEGNGEECDGDSPITCTSSCGTQGEQLCESCAWSDCYPPDEICNGEDDDCDGQCDNGFDCCIGVVEDPCTTCDGAGSAVGTRTCSDMCGWGPCCADADYCNGCDDDCNGETDETVEVAVDWRLTDNGAWSGGPSIAYNQADNEYGIVFHDGRYGDGEILFAAVAPDGNKIRGDERISTNAGHSTGPSLVHTGSEYGVAWEDQRHGAPEIYFARFDNSGVRLGAEIRITDSPNDAEHVSLVFTGSEFALAWDDERHGGANNDEIYFARIDSSGMVLTANIRITDAAGFSRYPSLLFTGSEFAAAWFSNKDGNREIYFNRFTGDGILVGPDMRITDDPADSEGASLVFNGTEFGVAWIDARAPGLGVYFARIDASGTKIGTDIRVSDSSDGVPASAYIYINSTSLKWDSANSQYGLVWYDDRHGNAEVYFTRLAADGTTILPEYRASNGTGYSVEPALARGASHWVLAWRDSRHGGTNSEVYYSIFGCLPLP